MTQFSVTGMSCAACSARVEKAVNNVDGVTSCSVSLLTNSMGVEGTASAKDIISAVEKAGYGAQLKDGSKKRKSSEYDEFEDKETPKLVKRLVSSAVFLVILMYFSMGHMMWSFPLPKFYENNHIAMGITQLLLTVIIMVINQRFFISGYKALFKRAPNMDTLVALGSTAAFLYSTYALFAMTRAQVDGNMQAVEGYMSEFYFESAAMILALITVGKTLEARAKGKTTDALKSLIKLAPNTATVIKNGEYTEVPVEEVKVGDIFAVKPGERIPTDATVIKGESAVNESALTGESLPVEKAVGSKVYAGTINASGYLECTADKIGEDTTLSKIIQTVSDAAATKAPIAKVADKVSGVFVPVVMAIAFVTTAVWLIVNGNFGYALARGISVLVISCPCALGLATPVAIMVGNGVGAKNGILFKTAEALEQTGKINTVVLDKTGTITKGEPQVTDIYSPITDEKELISLAAALESQSEHPLALAITERAKADGIKTEEITDFKAVSGNGLKAKLNGKDIFGGNLKYISDKVDLPSDIAETADKYSSEGKTPLFFAYDNKFLGIIAVADVIKPDSHEAIKELQNMGIRVIMLTGDNEKTAKAIGKKAGVDEVIAGVLPDGKDEVIRSLQKNGSVAMVGDGINDAPALTRADIGMAIAAGTDIAVDSADIVLMQSSLRDVPAAIRLSRSTLKNIHENLFWAFFYNSIGIPLAAGLFVKFGITLNPMFGAAAMSLSSFCVVMNALRLNFCKIYSTKHDRKINKSHSKKENKEMEITVKINGMMCPHCENHVKTALEELENVTEVTADFKTAQAVIKASGAVDSNKIKEAVEKAGYEFVGIE